MRRLTILSIILFSLGCNTTKKNNTNGLNGNWIPVKQEIGGTLLPNSVFKNQKLIIKDSNYTLIAESVDKGLVKNNGNKMDIYGKEGVNAGKHFTAITKMENGQMIICYNLVGDSYPDAFETKGKPMYFLSVFEKEQVK
jgi:uncharacterized protein (TIGR03067 family)